MFHLYTSNSLFGKCLAPLSSFFEEQSLPTAQNLLFFCLSFIVLRGCESIKSLHENFISKYSKKSLESFYYLLKNQNVDINSLSIKIILFAVSIFHKISNEYPTFIIVDDSLFKKYGKKFEGIKYLFNHVTKTHDNAHCFVQVMLAIPTETSDGKIDYLSVPVGYRGWLPKSLFLENNGLFKGRIYKEKNKIAYELCKMVIDKLPKNRNICILMDSWYTNKALIQLWEEYENVDIMAAMKSNTVMYSENPVVQKPKKKRGRKPADPTRKAILDSRIQASDIPVHKISGLGYLVGCSSVRTNIFGLDNLVTVYRTKSQKENNRLFVCTNPGLFDLIDVFKIKNIQDNALSMINSNKKFIPLAMYAIRWEIEIFFYQQKFFWNIDDYKVRTFDGIERLVNLISATYAITTMLPYLVPELAPLQGKSPQKIRACLSEYVERQIYFQKLLQDPELDELPPEVAEHLERILLRMQISA